MATVLASIEGRRLGTKSTAEPFNDDSEAEMGVTAWLRAIKAWPDLEDRLTYHLMDEDEKAFRANQRALNLPPPQPQSEAA